MSSCVTSCAGVISVRVTRTEEQLNVTCDQSGACDHGGVRGQSVSCDQGGVRGQSVSCDQGGGRGQSVSCDQGGVRGQSVSCDQGGVRGQSVSCDQGGACGQTVLRNQDVVCDRKSWVMYNRLSRELKSLKVKFSDLQKLRLKLSHEHPLSSMDSLGTEAGSGVENSEIAESFKSDSPELFSILK